MRRKIIVKPISETTFSTEDVHQFRRAQPQPSINIRNNIVHLFLMGKKVYVGETFIGNRVISRLIYFLEKVCDKEPFYPFTGRSKCSVKKLFEHHWVKVLSVRKRGGSPLTEQPEPPSMAPYKGGLKRRGCSVGRSLVSRPEQVDVHISTKLHQSLPL